MAVDEVEYQRQAEAGTRPGTRDVGPREAVGRHRKEVAGDALSRIADREHRDSVRASTVTRIGGAPWLRALPTRFARTCWSELTGTGTHTGAEATASRMPLAAAASSSPRKRRVTAARSPAASSAPGRTRC